jgi:hypothetical protein
VLNRGAVGPARHRAARPALPRPAGKTLPAESDRAVSALVRSIPVAIEAGLATIEASLAAVVTGAAEEGRA